MSAAGPAFTRPRAPGSAGAAILPLPALPLALLSLLGGFAHAWAQDTAGQKLFEQRETLMQEDLKTAVFNPALPVIAPTAETASRTRATRVAPKKIRRERRSEGRLMNSRRNIYVRNLALDVIARVASTAHDPHR